MNVDWKDPYIDPKVGHKYLTSLKNQQTLNFTKKEGEDGGGAEEAKSQKVREMTKAIKGLGLKRNVKL